MMLAVRLHGARDLRLHDEVDPAPGPNEELVRVAAVGICGSDLHWWEDGGSGTDRVTSPLILGHEAAGIIETGPRRGERVAVEPGIPCGHCERCLEGDPHLCPRVRHAAHAPVDGSLCELIAWPAAQLHPLPDSLSDSDGALLEPLGIALHAISLAPLFPGATVGVFGCGPIGLLIVQLARLSGAARIVATDRLEHRLAAARKFGATEVLAASEEGTGLAVRALTGGRGLDVVFEAAGENSALEDSVEAARAGGHVVVVGIFRSDAITFSSSKARTKELRIAFSQRMKHTYPRAIEIAARNLVDLASLSTHAFSLAQAPEAFEFAARRSGLKVLIRP